MLAKCMGVATVLLSFWATTFATAAELQEFKETTSARGSAPSSIDPLELIKSGIDSRSVLDPRIVGGEPADIKDTPWQVALVFARYSDPNRAQFCGGTIIDTQWIVTAAHCIQNTTVLKDPKRVDVVANTTFFSTGGDRLGAQAVFVHERYSPANYDYDIALIKLADHHARLSTVSLAAADQTIAGNANVLVTGWGARLEGGQGTPYLIGANIPTVSRSACKEGYGDRLTTRMFCAGKREGGLDSCQGDSGGPAVAVTASGSVLLGIVSNGEGCARRLKYGIYTSVPALRVWIDTIMTNN